MKAAISKLIERLRGPEWRWEQQVGTSALYVRPGWPDSLVIARNVTEAGYLVKSNGLQLDKIIKVLQAILDAAE